VSALPPTDLYHVGLIVNDIDAAAKIIAGTARSMGVEIK